MFVLRSTLDRALATLSRKSVELIQARDDLASASKARREWRNAFREQLGQRRKIEGERDAATARALSAEAAYHALVHKMLTPPAAPPAHAPVDPEIASLDRISKETVDKMAEQFVRDGLSPDVARQHAEEIVSMAERAWGGAPGDV